MNAINRREMLAGLVAAPLATAVGAKEEPKKYSFKQMVELLHTEATVPPANRDRFVWAGMGSDNGLNVWNEPMEYLGNRGGEGAPAVHWVLTGDHRIAAEWIRGQGKGSASWHEITSLAKLVQKAKTDIFMGPFVTCVDRNGCRVSIPN